MKHEKQEEMQMKEAENVGWKLHNAEKPYEPTAEESLDWLDGMRAFMFEVWKNNPDLRKQYEEFQESERSRQIKH